MRKVLLKILGPRLFAPVKALVDEIRIQRNHSRGCRAIRRRFAGRCDLRVQFGCGPFAKKGWINTDIWPGPWAIPDFCLDVSRPLPFADSSVVEFYSEHMFEHIDYPDAVLPFLRECFRCLVPGGKMTLGVPDVDAIIEAYLKDKGRLSPPTDSEKSYCVMGHPLERMNYSFRQNGEHKFLYSFSFMHDLLLKEGFVGIARREWDPGQDMEHRREGTLYVVAHRPETNS